MIMLPAPPRLTPNALVTAVVTAYRQAYDILRRSDLEFGITVVVQRSLLALRRALRQPLEPAQVQELLQNIEIRRRQYQMWGLIEQAERAIERSQARKLNLDTIAGFGCFNNYGNLVDAEIAKLGAVPMKPEQTILFMEPGEVPVSPILMHMKTGRPITCISRDPRAVVLGKELIARCGLAGDITYLQTNPKEYDLYYHPVVFVSTWTINKGNVLKHIVDSNAVMRLAVRSAVGSGTLLYPPLTTRLATDLKIGFSHAPTAVDCAHITAFAWLGDWPEHKARTPFRMAQENLHRVSFSKAAKTVKGKFVPDLH